MRIELGSEAANDSRAGVSGTKQVEKKSGMSRNEQRRIEKECQSVQNNVHTRTCLTHTVHQPSMMLGNVDENVLWPLT